MRKLISMHVLALCLVVLTFSVMNMPVQADETTEIHILVLTLLLVDDTQEHTGIRGFYALDECTKFMPIYQELIGKFDNPGNIKRSELTCFPLTITVTGEK